MNLLYYSGIGSRRTPENIQELMVKLGHYLAGRGWVLRSGGAEGADTAFEKGCDQVHGRKEIFLPWKGYNNNKSPFFYKGKLISDDIKHQSFELASQYHPAWGQCSYGAKCLLARDGMQILGKDLKTPVSMVLFWSPDPNHGGTSQALRIARDHKIVIFNLGDTTEREMIINRMDLEADFLGETSYNLFE
jgi:hypothetical protein